MSVLFKRDRGGNEVVVSDQYVPQPGDTCIWEGRDTMNFEVLTRPNGHGMVQIRAKSASMGDATRWVDQDEIKCLEPFKGSRKKQDSKPEYKAASDGFYLTRQF